MAIPRNYIFPVRAEVDPLAAAAAPSASDLLIQDAIARGYQDGRVEGREAARAALETSAEAARQRAAEEGREAGLAELKSVADTLRAAIEEATRAREASIEDAEAFAVELALGAVARIAAVDEVRRDFIKRTIAAGLSTLSPQPPIEILLNPADAVWAKRALSELPVRPDENISPGAVRIDAGRILVETGIDEALETIRNAVFATRARRARTRQS
jgi:flagellar biosynthesis/type III secretory pathway protein FliH